MLSAPIPNNLLSTASFICSLGYSTLKASSSDFLSSARCPFRSTGVSFAPSGIHVLCTQGVPNCLPISAAIARQRATCSTQNLRFSSFLLDRVKPSAARGCEKQVALKSRPISRSLAQSIQP